LQFTISGETAAVLKFKICNIFAEKQFKIAKNCCEMKTSASGDPRPSGLRHRQLRHHQRDRVDGRSMVSSDTAPEYKFWNRKDPLTARILCMYVCMYVCNVRPIFTSLGIFCEPML
jgi:hypothetical protein